MGSHKSDGGRVVAPPALIVEPEFFLQGELRAVLAEIGLDVSLYPSSEKALPRARETTFSLAVLGAPSIDLSDVRLANLLKEGNPSIPLILLTSPAALLKVSEPGPLTGALHLPKPFRMSKLRSLVVEILGLTESEHPGTTIPYASGSKKEKDSDPHE